MLLLVGEQVFQRATMCDCELHKKILNLHKIPISNNRDDQADDKDSGSDADDTEGDATIALVTKENSTATTTAIAPGDGGGDHGSGSGGGGRRRRRRGRGGGRSVRGDDSGGDNDRKVVASAVRHKRSRASCSTPPAKLSCSSSALVKDEVYGDYLHARMVAEAAHNRIAAMRNQLGAALDTLTVCMLLDRSQAHG
jgi:hypothetical protein